jgi:hypothetical protein
LIWKWRLHPILFRKQVLIKIAKLSIIDCSLESSHFSVFLSLSLSRSFSRRFVGLSFNDILFVTFSAALHFLLYWCLPCRLLPFFPWRQLTKMHAMRFGCDKGDTWHLGIEKKISLSRSHLELYYRSQGNKKTLLRCLAQQRPM